MKIGYRVACEADTHVQATVSQCVEKKAMYKSLSLTAAVKKEIVLCAEAARKQGGNGDCHYFSD